MWKLIVGSAALLAAGWVSFAVLTGLDTADVVRYNQLDRHVGTATFRAGDVVSVSPDGLRPDFLCSMALEDGLLRDAPLHKTYHNWLDESLPAFARAVAWSKAVFGGELPADALDRTGTRIDFNGRFLELPAENARPRVEEACVCAIARKLVQRHTVCMVSESLNETSLVQGADGGLLFRERTIGASYRQLPILIPDLGALECPGLSSAARIPKTSQSCPGAEVMSPVWLRDKLRVIRESDPVLASN